ncbi:TPA: HNH endonuclease [Streptococcus suis]|nr:HNH endonuclease [Streptococcus suis]HEM6356425.1 HNH endonuclease [Streptococcus suis]HEM6380559.1 HNH endonuclease [Streptococcus suis]HEM6409779.1 HNH endonuclease [Streptococcus suis]
MPRKPKRPCSYPSCPKLTEGRFCMEHERQENKRYEQYDRDSVVRKRYGHTWRKIRASYVKAHPYCELCFKEGRMKRVEEVHHIKPLSEGGTHDTTNLISLCQSCHSKIHARNGSRWNKRKG